MSPELASPVIIRLWTDRERGRGQRVNRESGKVGTKRVLPAKLPLVRF